MRGTVKFAKFPKGIYFAMIEDVKAGVTSAGKDIIIVLWRIRQGPRQGEAFKERMNSVSENFLRGINQPCKLNDAWDTEHWKGQLCWVTVDYSPDEHQWQRYRHSQIPPKESGESATEPSPPEIPAESKTVIDEDDIPF